MAGEAQLSQQMQHVRCQGGGVGGAIDRTPAAEKRGRSGGCGVCDFGCQLAEAGKLWGVFQVGATPVVAGGSVVVAGGGYGIDMFDSLVPHGAQRLWGDDHSGSCNLFAVRIAQHAEASCYVARHSV